MNNYTFDRSRDEDKIIPDDEPDHVKGYTRHGFQFIIKRNRWSGALLGYIRVPKGHPWYKAVTGKRWMKPLKQFAYGRYRVFHMERWEYKRLEYVNVHRGLTYGGRMTYKNFKQRGWWIGFDCAHYMDLVPTMRDNGGSYKDLKFVLNEIDGLSRQMKEAY